LFEDVDSLFPPELPLTPEPPVAQPPAAPPPKEEPKNQEDDLAAGQVASEAHDAPAIPAPSEAPPESRPLPQGLIMSVVNQKGGVGKTTTTINLGAALAEQGAKVLLVDLDPQGALSVGLGVQAPDLDMTVYNLLLQHDVAFEQIRHATDVEGLDILPSNIDLSVAELQLVSEVAREQILTRKLGPAKQIYNYILIDCPPSLGLLTVNALTASQGVLIPLECEYFALRGLALLLQSIDKVKERLNPDLEIVGILPTMLDSRVIHSREVLSRVADAYGDKLFKTSIRKTIRFAEAPVVGKPILTYAPASAGAQEYRDLAKEVMSR